MKMIVDVKQRLYFLVRPRSGTFVSVNDVVLETFSAQMHVWEEAEQRRIVRQSAACFHAIIRHVWRNHEVVVGQLQRHDTLGWRVLCKNQSHAGAVAGRASIG